MQPAAPLLLHLDRKLHIITAVIFMRSLPQVRTLGKLALSILQCPADDEAVFRAAKALGEVVCMPSRKHQHMHVIVGFAWLSASMH